MQLLDPLVNLDEQGRAGLGHRAHRIGPQQPAAVNRDQAVADLLDLPEQVARDQYRDAELSPDPRDQLEHACAAGRIKAVRRLVKQQQPGVTDQRLGQLHSLLHAGRVGTDLAIPLLVQTDVTKRVRRSFPGGGGRQP